MKEKLEKLLENSYSPYSNYAFSCIVEMEDGSLYSGVNVENASFGATICAERNAINAAITDGKRNFKAVYLMSNKNKFLMPCNLCKQTMIEFFDNKVIFNIMNKSGEMKIMTFNDILNTRFTKDDLK